MRGPGIMEFRQDEEGEEDGGGQGGQSPDRMRRAGRMEEGREEDSQDEEGREDGVEAGCEDREEREYSSTQWLPQSLDMATAQTPVPECPGWTWASVPAACHLF